MGELLGYARVSTLEQNAALQRGALDAAGCWRVFTDHVSGVKESRPCQPPPRMTAISGSWRH